MDEDMEVSGKMFDQPADEESLFGDLKQAAGITKLVDVKFFNGKFSE